MASQRWYCLSVTVPCEATEAVANFLIELGSAGVVEGVHEASQPQASTADVQGFFPAESFRSALCDALFRYLDELAALFPRCGHPVPHLTEITSQVWAEQWREHFPPIQVGTRFLLLPPWTPRPLSPDRLVIIIEPSMAFGTGHHATTQGCLEAIEILCTSHGVPARALDLGTGSGVLAIALAKLGTKRVWATDIDAVALDEARKNVDANQVTPYVHISDLPLERLPTPFPLIVANLFATTLVALAPSLRIATEHAGHVILSGIQADQEADIRAGYQSPDWYPATRLVQDEWVTLMLQRA